MQNSSPDDSQMVLELKLSEVRALYRILEFQYIPHNNTVGNEVVTRIARIVRDHEQELARLPSRTT